MQLAVLDSRSHNTRYRQPPTVYLRVLLCTVVLSSYAFAQGTQDGKLVPNPDERAPKDFFGASVAVSGNTVVVGADQRDEPGVGTNSGMVYVFDLTNVGPNASGFTRKLVPSDLGANFDFGSSVAVDGNLVVAGASQADTNGTGVAYVFSAGTGSQVGKLTTSLAAARDRFGFSVGIEGQTETVVVGSPNKKVGGVTGAGAAYVFANVSACGNNCTATELSAPQSERDLDDQFGHSVAISGDNVIVGAPGELFTNPQFPSPPGTAYVFSASSGQLLYKLTNEKAQVESLEGGNSFGFSVAIDGDLAIVGAPSGSSGVIGNEGNNTGAAYVFRLDGNNCQAQMNGPALCTWTSKLIADNSMSLDLFGASVDIDGTRAIVGAPLARSAVDQPPHGVAYVFDVSGTGDQLFELSTPGTAMAGDAFGNSVAMDGKWAGVGAVQEDDGTGCTNNADCNSGSAYRFNVASLQAGDADQDLDFDQPDLVKVQIAAKYLTLQPATWGDGDWNRAPGGRPGDPPVGDGVFNQFDIIAAQLANVYLKGKYAAIRATGQEGDGQTSIGYDARTGEIWIDAPLGRELTSVNVDSAAAIFTGDPAQGLGGSFDNDADNNIFKATFGSSFGSISFGQVAQPGLSEEFLLGDLSVIGSLAGGGDLGEVDLIHVVPEPSTLVALLTGAICLLVFGGRIRRLQEARCPIGFAAHGSALRRCAEILPRPGKIARWILFAAVLSFGSPRCATAVQTGMQANLVFDIDYTFPCNTQSFLTCGNIEDDKFSSRFFSGGFWKTLIDPPSVIEAKFRVSYDVRAVPIAVRYNVNYVEVEPPAAVDGGPNDDGTATLIIHTKLSPDIPVPEDSVDLVEIIFADAAPSEDPSLVEFMAFGEVGDFIQTADRPDPFLGPDEIGRATGRYTRPGQNPQAPEDPLVDDRLLPGGQLGDGRFSIFYNARTGEVGVDGPPTGPALSAIDLESESGIFASAQPGAPPFDGQFDVAEPGVLFKTEFGTSGFPIDADGDGQAFLSFGNIATPGLFESELLKDLTVVAALNGGGRAGIFDLVYVNNPEPSSMVLAGMGLLLLAACRWCQSRRA